MGTELPSNALYIDDEIQHLLGYVIRSSYSFNLISPVVRFESESKIAASFPFGVRHFGIHIRQFIVDRTHIAHGQAIPLWGPHNERNGI